VSLVNGAEREECDGKVIQRRDDSQFHRANRSINTAVVVISMESHSFTLPTR
jgi:hypothetical protein